MSSSENSSDNSNGPSVLGLFGMVAGATAAIFAPFVLMYRIQQSNIEDKYKFLDSKETVLFTSVQDCVNQGYSKFKCQCSWEQADEIDSHTSFGYRSEEDVSRNHQEYSVTKRKYHKNYEPLFKAWYASLPDICEASVPLYSGPKPGVYIRGDMRMVECACRATSP